MRIIRIKKCKDCIYCSIVPTKQRSGWCDFKEKLVWRKTQFEDNFPKWCPLEKPLAELAERLCISIEIFPPDEKFWNIVLHLGEKRKEGMRGMMEFKGETYAIAEQKARKWLEKQ